MRYLVAGAGGLILLLGVGFAAVDASSASGAVSSLSTYVISLGLLLLLGGFYVELGRAASALERMLAENEKRRVAERQEKEQARQQEEAARRLAASREEQQRRQRELQQRWNVLSNVEPERTVDISQHRLTGVAGNLRMFAWVILIGGIIGGLAASGSREAEVGVAGIPIGVLLCVLLRSLAAVIDLLAEACVLLRRIDDREAIKGMPDVDLMRDLTKKR